MKNKRPILWSIAGSDCSGGAGIQADVKTGHALGCEVCTLITANTVQNSKRLDSINLLPVSILQQQADCLLEDKPPAAIKIGLIANNDQLTWLIGFLNDLKSISPETPVVLDPVMKASVGQDLSCEAMNKNLFQQLIALTDVMTPNRQEAEQLTGLEDGSPEVWAKALMESGAKGVIVTGGHGADAETIIDHCFFDDQHLNLKSPRAHTSYGHGSGCTHSSAIASFLAQGYLLRDAFIQAQAFINEGFALCPAEQNHYGALIQPCWPVSSTSYPQVVLNPLLETVADAGFPSLGIQNLGLYPVVDSVEWLESLMPLGIEIIQLRLKNKTESELREAIQQAVELSKRYPTRLFINDHWHMAIEYGAYGVHLGQEDVLDADLKAIQKAGLRLGISTHGAYEFVLAQQLKPSYLAIGAIFPTRTKDMSGQIQGLDNLKQILTLKSDIPIVGIGGLTLDNANEVIQTGVNSIAVVTAVTESPDYAESVKRFQRLFSKLINTKN